jgi:hypothetical protein
MSRSPELALPEPMSFSLVGDEEVFYAGEVDAVAFAA